MVFIKDLLLCIIYSEKCAENIRWFTRVSFMWQSNRKWIVLSISNLLHRKENACAVPDQRATQSLQALLKVGFDKIHQTHCLHWGGSYLKVGVTFSCVTGHITPKSHLIGMSKSSLATFRLLCRFSENLSFSMLAESFRFWGEKCSSERSLAPRLTRGDFLGLVGFIISLSCKVIIWLDYRLSDIGELSTVIDKAMVAVLIATPAM